MRRRPGTAVLAAVLLAWWAPAETDELDEIRALGAERRYAEALRRLDAHLEKDPRDVEARLYKGVVLTRQGRTEEAIGVFDALSEDEPELPEPLNNMAVLYAAQGRYEEARESLLRAIALEPNYDTAHENLGDVYAKLASLAYERAYALNDANEGAKDKADWMVRVLDTGVPVANDMAAAGETRSGGAALSAPPRASAGTQACYAIEGVADEDAAQALVAWLRSQGASAAARTRESRHVATYTVYLPAVQSLQAAEQRIRELRAEGFVDIMRIRRGELANAISAGVYRNLDNAERRAARLRELGYEAVLKPNYASGVVHWVEVSAGGGHEVQSRLTASFPEYRLSAKPCSGT